MLPDWEDVRHFADLATIGLFLVTLYLVYLTARLSQPEVARMSSDSAAPSPLRILGVLRPRSRKVTAILATVSGILTIILFLYAGRPIAGSPGPQGIPGPPGASGLTDPRIQEDIAKLKQNVTELLRLAFLERCQQRLDAVEAGFDESTKAARTNVEAQFGGRPFPTTWYDKLSELQAITKQCAPSIDSRLEPTEDQMHTKTADEPSNADPDLIYKIRKFNYQQIQATTLVRNLKGTLAGKIANLGDRAGQEMGQP
jgi:hypothetical protein